MWAVPSWKIQFIWVNVETQLALWRDSGIGKHPTQQTDRSSKGLWQSMKVLKDRMRKSSTEERIIVGKVTFFGDRRVLVGRLLHLAWGDGEGPCDRLLYWSWPPNPWLTSYEYIPRGGWKCRQIRDDSPVWWCSLAQETPFWACGFPFNTGKAVSLSLKIAFHNTLCILDTLPTFHVFYLQRFLFRLKLFRSPRDL